MLNLLRRLCGLMLLVLLFALAKVHAQCDAAFAFDQKQCLGDSSALTSLASIDIIASEWDFGDGNTDTGLLVNHLYTQTGVFTIRHIVEELGGCKDTAYDTVTIITAPVLSFSSDQNCTDSLVYLYGLKTGSASDTLGTLKWFTGTGDSLTGDTVSYSYPSSGYYTIRLEVQGTSCSSTLDSLVFIRQRPQADFSNDAALCKGDTVSFQFTGSAHSASYRWNFGDVFSGGSNTDSVANPRHRFSNSGNYNVRLVITDTLSCRDTLIQSISIKQNAVANFDYSNGCLGMSTSFSSTSQHDASDSISSYFWDFGDGDTSGTGSPLHAYADTGTYTVQLIIETASGCIDTVIQSQSIFLQPAISLGEDSACRGSSVDFQLDNPSTAVQAYLWNFGDGFTSTAAAPAHQYTSTGNFYVSLRTTFTNGKSCTSDADSILVMALPGASFVIDTDTQCFKGNEVCVHITNQSSNTLRRRVLFDDGFVDISNGPVDTFVCHTYSDIAGGSYFIAVQMLDSNGCSQSIGSDTAVLIYPEFDTEFTQNASNGCFVTNVNFTNTSNQNPPEVVDFYWDFGDGTTNTTDWFFPSHTYSLNGSFDVKLWAENEDGCQDSSFGSSSITNVTFTVDAQIDSMSSGCSSNNRIYASQTPVPGGTIQWIWQSGDTSSNFSPTFSYEFPNTYFPRVIISLNGCDSIKYLDTIAISGPYARIGSITNRYQCEISDTVYAINTSTYYLNTQHGAIWDFGDPFAASCTTNYLAGVNATSNCRYATDSVNTKHFYDVNQEACYSIRMIAYDSVSGCRDTVTEFLALTPPVAGPDTALGLQGLFTIQNKTCLGPEDDKQISISLTQTQPLCGKEIYWVMWDSACAVASGNFNGQWLANQTEHNYSYANAPCDPNGYVTIGLIVQNGDDSLGNICRDTAWYHNILRFNFMDPRFGSSYDPAQYYCAGSSFDFYLLEQDQDSVNRVIWYWGDGQITDTTTTDTVSHQFAESGTYTIVSQIYTTDGCTGTDTFTINVGVMASIGFTANTLCLGDSFQILPNINYLNDFVNYWNDSSRIAANKEARFFDLGDGNGFQDLGTQPWVYSDAIKNYSISIAFRDSVSCWDTINYSDSVRVFGVFAEFSTIEDTFLCPQAIAFTDLSSLYDSSAGYIQADDSLVQWSWDYGSGLANSSLQHPERYLGTGSYTVELLATNTTGCSDSISKTIVVVGPVAHYSFVADSFGCEPLRVYFKNESSNATNYVWQFNDSSNAVLSTTSDSVFYFDYAIYGNFVASLTAQGSFDQDGISISCEAEFPDSTAWDSLRLVSVYETPIAGFSFQTDCATKSSVFQNESVTENNSTLSYIWDFGDGDTSSEEHPTHFYADTGHYTVVLHVFSELGCEDTLAQTVIIAPQPVAWFTYNEVCLGSTTFFQDSTEAFNDLIYDWQWDFGDGAASTLEDPFHDFGADSSFTVELVVTNVGGCRDTVSRDIRIHSFPNADFTSSPECRYDSVEYTDASTSVELPLSYTWTFGDGTFSNTASPRHLYSTSGTKLTQLHIETQWGCADSVTYSQDVYQEPAADFSINDSGQCLAEQNFLFDDQSTAGTGSYTVAWDFGDGNTDAGIAVSHTYSLAGSYDVAIFLESVFNCRDTASKTLQVFPQSQAGFLVNDLFQCEYENSFVYTDTSWISSGSISRSWLSGDGNSSTDSIYTHHYNDTGYYEVSLILLSDLACRDTITRQILVNPSPRADFVIDDSTQCFRDHVFSFANTTQLSKGVLYADWDFGDGVTDDLLNLTHSYPIDSTWSIRLISTSDSGCMDTAYHGVITYPMPVASFGLSGTTSCLSGNSFSYYDSTTIHSGTWTLRWFFGDGDSSTSVSPSHSYPAEGVYSPLLIATSNFGCNDTFSRDLEVYPMPDAIIGMEDTTLCFRDHFFAFADSSTLVYGQMTRQWDFGDGNGDTALNVIHSYAIDSSYLLSLRVYSEHNCSDSAFRTYIVYPQAHADFSIDDSIQCFSDHLFTMTNLSQVNSGSMSYIWDFGDGNSLVTQNASHTYVTHGTYSITLEAQTPNLCADTLQKLIRIDPNPEALIGLADSQDCFRDHLFTFIDSSSIASGSTSREWSFGDGATDTSLQTTHAYASEGSYLVALRVLSDLGCRDSAFRSYEVFPQAAAGFDINDTIQCFNGHLFQFSNQSQVSSGTLSYFWDFGDTETDNTANPDHVYALFGDYTVTLIAQTPNFCADTLQRTLRIDPNPLAKIWLNDSFQCINAQSFSLRDSSSLAEGTYQRFWDLGDGATSQLDAFVHPYSTLGIHTINLLLISDKNCRDSSSLDIEVYPKPDPAFVINDSAQCENDQLFSFTDQSSISSGTYSPVWTFGDGNSSVLQDPDYQYSYADTFKVVLELTSNYGCLDSVNRSLVVFPKPHASWVINDTAQCVNTNDFQFTAQVMISSGGYRNYFWDLENDLDSGDLDTARTYATLGNYPVYFYVQSLLNCWDTLSTVLTVHPKPHAQFSINDSNQCVNTQDIVFDNQSTISAGTLSWFWEFGDGDTSSAFEPVKTYAQHDSLIVTHYAQSDLGCYDTTTHQMVILPKPMVEYSVNDSDQCVNGNLFSFVNGSTVDYGYLNYLWDFGDGQVSSSANWNMSYAAHGSYPVKLKAVSNLGCSDSLIKTMIVYPKPTPGFAVNDEGQCFNTQDFQFIDQSSIAYGNLHYSYRFAGTDIDTNANPSYFFPAFGNYTVRQVLSSDYGCKDSIDAPIRVFPKPTAQFSVNDSSQCINDQFFFFASSSNVAQGNLQSENWDFDDGAQAIGRVVNHQYGNSDFYLVALHVQTDSNCWDTAWKELRVFPKPVAAIGYNDSAQCLSSNRYEVYSQATDSAGIQLWRWIIGQDSTAGDSSFTYSFKTEGAKRFLHWVQSVDGCWDTTARFAFVKPMPDPTFSGLNSFHCNNEAAFALTPVVPGGIFSGQNIVDQLFDPKILWEDTVKYVVTVNGCTDSSQKKTEVYPFPVVDLGPDTVLCKNEFLRFDLSFWNSQYFVQDITARPEYVISKPGIHYVAVTNVCGTDYDTVQVSYLDDLCRIYLPNAFTPNGDDFHQNYKPVEFDLEIMDYIIYNRWGQIMYKGNIDDAGWDGTFKGTPVKQDVYLILVNYSYTLHGEKVSGILRGNITLLR